MYTPHLLTIRQIASWKGVVLEVTPTPVVRAEPPPLQRGLVWSPLQIELLWDSLLRGFPIGCLVVCRTRTPRRDEAGQVTHDLLDGQQRAQAIALGYTDPFTDGVNASSILWIDLDASGANAGSAGSRRFLFRVTTTAHPWGYRKRDDQLERLSLPEIRSALIASGFMDQEHKPTKFDNGRRLLPRPIQCWPHVATAPVPFSWVVAGCRSAGAQPQVLRDSLRESLRALRARVGADALPWVNTAITYLDDDAAVPSLRSIVEGLLSAEQVRIPCLEVGDHIFDAPDQAQHGVTIDDLEQLFARINNGGTRIDPDDLQYSMIKAYWPDVRDVIDAIEPRRVPEARLVVLGARLALSPALPAQGTSPLHSAIGIRELRGFAGEGDKEPDLQLHRQPLLRMLTDLDGNPAGIRPVIDIVQNWLSWDANNRAYGLPPVLVTSIARSSGEVFLLLMWLADRWQAAGQNPEGDGLCQRIIGLATTLHWLALNRTRAVSAIARELSKRLQMGSQLTARLFENLLQYALSEDGNLQNRWLISPLSTDAFREAIPLPNAEQLNSWRWWRLPPYDGSAQNVGECVRTLKSNTELLLYAQRQYICREFPMYDPARKDSWDVADRPWDFDHILPKSKIDWKALNGHKDALKEWTTQGNCIANLRALWREQNRSDQGTLPSAKIENEGQRSDSFITDYELSAFDQCAQAPMKPETVLPYFVAARMRLARIYGEWYDSLYISEIS